MANDFTRLVTGSIGQLSYHKKNKIKLSPEQTQKKIDEFTSARINAMITQQCLGHGADLSQAYSKSRSDSKEDLKLITQNTTINTIHYQIGQKDSYDELTQIESEPDFSGWVDPIQIEAIKAAHIIS